MQNVSVRRLWCVNQTQRNSHTHKLACWKLQRGKETGLPSTGWKRKKEKGKRKTKSYASEQKQKWRQKVKERIF